MSELTYLLDSSLNELTSNFLQLDKDEKGYYCITDRTIFYPQGGGQPSDQGKIYCNNHVLNISQVRFVGNEVRHYINIEDPLFDFDSPVSVLMKIDSTIRLLNTQYHTAGHLIAGIVEQLDPDLKAIKGHQFPGEAYVEFDGSFKNEDVFLKNLNSKIQSSIQSDAKIYIYQEDSVDSKNLRMVQIEGFEAIPCGGTHVNTLSQIGTILITKCKFKNGKLKISYSI